ncbi:MAG: glutamate--tRNA ligase [Candidatus Asgardarchaeia archaeon]
MSIDDTIKRIITKYALLNAIKHDGKASTKAVMSKVIAEKPELRKNARDIAKYVTKVIEEINKLSPEKQYELLKEEFPEALEEEEKKKEFKRRLPPLPNVEKYKEVTMRLAPYPSGPLHIGNARMVILNDEYVKMYKGRLILAYDDTIGSEEKRILPEAYDLIKEGLEWLGVKWHKTIYKSDRIPIFYEYAKKLIEMGMAYVCTCDPETFRVEYKMKKRPCPDRDLPIETHLERWEKMIEGFYKEREAVVRLKTGMDLDNPAYRDVPIMRISYREHPRVGQKYIVWPLLEFNWAIDDHLLGITHILRGKDLIKEDFVEEFVWNIFGWEKAEFIHYGIVKFKGVSLSKSKARKLIEEGVYRGWDDPRTWSLQALDARGIKPEALRQALLDLGLSLTDIEYSPENLYAYNRKLIDKEAKRLFFIANPIEIKVKGVPDDIKYANLPWHPDIPSWGTREIPIVSKGTNTHIFIDKADWDTFKNETIVRLKELFNIKILDKDTGLTEYHSKDVEQARKVNAKIIHWVPKGFDEKMELIMPDGSVLAGIVEKNVRKIKPMTVVQFERFGFVKIHKIEPPFGYYTHD